MTAKQWWIGSTPNPPSVVFQLLDNLEVPPIPPAQACHPHGVTHVGSSVLVISGEHARGVGEIQELRATTSVVRVTGRLVADGSFERCEPRTLHSARNNSLHVLTPHATSAKQPEARRQQAPPERTGVQPCDGDAGEPHDVHESQCRGDDQQHLQTLQHPRPPQSQQQPGSSTAMSATSGGGRQPCPGGWCKVAEWPLSQHETRWALFQVQRKYDLVLLKPESRAAFLDIFRTQDSLPPSSNPRVRTLAKAEFGCRQGPKHKRDANKPRVPLRWCSTLKCGCTGRLRLMVLASTPGLVVVEEAGEHTCSSDRLLLAPRESTGCLQLG